MFLHFVENKDFRTYNINGQSINLKIHPDVFPPSQIGLAIANNLVIHSGETVLDMGCGSGIQAIYAAKLGGKAFANDFYEAPVASTIRNAQLNEVNVVTKQGRYFEGFEGQKFDVIIANIPQIMLPEAYKNSMTSLQNDIFDGGPNGNEVILHFLKNCGDFIHQKSRMYVGIYTGTDFIETMRFMYGAFKVRMLEIYSCPIQSSLLPHIEWYKELNANGKIHLTHSNGTYSAYTYICELSNL